MLTDDLLMYFPDYKKVGNEYKCKCPSHKDKNASLTIRPSEDKTLICCHAGCSAEKILNAIGLEPKDLYYEIQTQKEKFYNEATAKEYLKSIDNVAAVYEYRDQNSKLKYFKLRYTDKRFAFVRYIDNNLIWSLSKGTYYETFEGSNNYSSNEKQGKTIQLEETPKILYNLPKLVKATKRGNTVFVVEGEKDVDTLTKIGLVATTSPTGGGKGKNKWNQDYNEFLKGADVVILPDNDERIC